MQLRIIVLAGLLLLATSVALAQDEAETELELEAYAADGYGFSIGLPTAGVLMTPADEDWEFGVETAFEWRGEVGEPLVIIMGSVSLYHRELEMADVEGFHESIISSTMLQVEDGFEILARHEKKEFGAANWNVVSIRDSTAGEDLVLYIDDYATYNGPAIYSFTLCYLDPDDPAVAAAIEQVVASFELTGEPVVLEPKEPQAEE